MKSEKGMTLLTTAVLVLIIASLVFAVVYYARIQLEKESLEDLKTNLLLVQAKIKTTEGEYILDKKEENLKGTKIADMLENQNIKQFIDNNQINIEEKEKKYYVLNQENLNELELQKIQLDEASYFVVEYNDAEVYYTKGFKYTDGNIYYSIKDIEKLGTEEQ